MRAGPLVAFSLIAMGCACGADTPRHDDFAVGMTRADIRAQFGAPAATQSLTKSHDHIWGAIESFWPEIPTGSTVEIWSFSSTMAGQSGRTALYFVDDAEMVDGIGFHTDGVVY